MLNLLDKALFLKKVDPFRSLNLDLLLPIADKLALARFDRGDLLFSLGEEAHRMYFVVSGIVELLNGEGVVLRKLGPESLFGDECMFNDRLRGYGARSVGSSMLLTLSQTNLLAVISESPIVALGFLSLYADDLPDRSCRQLPRRSGEPFFQVEG